MILILYQIRKKLERKNYKGREEKGKKEEGKLADMKKLRMKIYITAQKLTTAKKKIRLRRAETFSSGLRPSSESGQFVGSF